MHVNVSVCYFTLFFNIIFKQFTNVQDLLLETEEKLTW